MKQYKYIKYIAMLVFLLCSSGTAAALSFNVLDKAVAGFAHNSSSLHTAIDNVGFFLSAYAEKLNARPDRLTTDSFAYEKDDALTDERLAFQFENAVLAESAEQGNLFDMEQSVSLDKAFDSPQSPDAVVVHGTDEDRTINIDITAEKPDIDTDSGFMFIFKVIYTWITNLINLMWNLVVSFFSSLR